MSGMAAGQIISAFTGLIDNANQRRHEKRQQRTFVSDRVRDARMAGVSPLAALGAAGYSGSSTPAGTGEFVGAFGRVIQDLTVDEKQAQIDATRAQTAGQRLTNEKLRTELLQKRLGAMREQAVIKNAPIGSVGEFPFSEDMSKNETLRTPVGNIKAEGGYTPNQQLQDRYGEAADIIGIIQLLSDVNIFDSKGKAARLTKRFRDNTQGKRGKHDRARAYHHSMKRKHSWWKIPPQYK